MEKKIFKYIKNPTKLYWNIFDYYLDNYYINKISLIFIII